MITCRGYISHLEVPQLSLLYRQLGTDYDCRFKPEANMMDFSSIGRPNPTDSCVAKLAKYVSRAFVKKTADTNRILEAIDLDGIPKALYALASGANVHSSRPDFNTSPRISSLNVTSEV
ncbi:hypothetical protein INT47_011264 [Mucor saturninus]|uniref:Uncharacterized protein n=1 Tax=Mucor saturninus TaxID=64648 RepID=A0A8H7RM67_9FUNG|nr:hypothetical protein INT47_011264 [Mucor saturninus]